MANRGREFEAEVKKSADKQDIFIWKIPDTYVPIKDISKAGWAPKMPADFIAHYDGVLFYIECKSTNGKSISIQRTKDDKSKMIQLHQWTSLLKFERKDVRCGLMLCFDNEGKHNVYWWRIKDFKKFLDKCKKKSCNEKDVIKYGGKRVKQEKAIKHYTYDIAAMLGQKS